MKGIFLVLIILCSVNGFCQSDRPIDGYWYSKDIYWTTDTMIVPKLRIESIKPIFDTSYDQADDYWAYYDYYNKKNTFFHVHFTWKGKRGSAVIDYIPLSIFKNVDTIKIGHSTYKLINSNSKNKEQ